MADPPSAKQPADVVSAFIPENLVRKAIRLPDKVFYVFSDFYHNIP
jgi:hypothetical protein